MTKFLPIAGLETVADAIELQALSEELDIAMVKALGSRIKNLDATAYGRAYRNVDRRDDRERQIALIRDVGQALGRLIDQPLVSERARPHAQAGAIGRIGRAAGFPRARP